jgi:hypothetical protein
VSRGAPRVSARPNVSKQRRAGWLPRPLGKLVGSPAFPITLTFPWLGPAGFIPLPVKYSLHFGQSLRFEGDPTEEDALVETKVTVVKDAIRELVRQGRAERKTWFP